MSYIIEIPLFVFLQLISYPKFIKSHKKNRINIIYVHL